MIQRYWIDRTDADVPHKSDDGEMVLYADHLKVVTELVLAFWELHGARFGFDETTRKKARAILAKYKEANTPANGALTQNEREQDNRSQRENTALNHEVQNLLNIREENTALKDENATLKDINLKQANDLLDANMAWASECEEVSALKVQAKRIDRVLDEEGAARSCINPLEDLRIAVRGLKQERDTYKEQAKALKAQVKRLKAPATNEEWNQFNVTLDPGGEPLIPRWRFNHIIAARVSAPVNGTEEAHNG